MLFLSASEEINKAPDSYWTSVMDIARRNNLSRIIRCSQIMGRNDTDELSAAQIFYPCMQCADIFFLKVPACLLVCPLACSLPGWLVSLSGCSTSTCRSLSTEAQEHG